jgi:hypothetical protein
MRKFQDELKKSNIYLAPIASCGPEYILGMLGYFFWCGARGPSAELPVCFLGWRRSYVIKKMKKIQLTNQTLKILASAKMKAYFFIFLLS